VRHGAIAVRCGASTRDHAAWQKDRRAMKNRRISARRLVGFGVGGFTLLEALVAVALMGVLLATLATVTAQWMPRWKAGFDRVERADLLGLGLDRIVADLAAAE